MGKSAPEPRGQMVPLKQHYDSRQSRWAPDYDPQWNARAHVTGRNDNPEPRQEPKLW